jgi:hypothetical protein
MSPLFRFLQFCFGGCSHRHTYRERRTLHGVQVLHWICDDCGHAVPAVERSAPEHQRVVQLGAIRRLTVRRMPAGVIAIDARPMRKYRSAS